MLSNLKTSTKVVAGFGVMLSILTVLGASSYIMFGRVNSNVTGLSDHNLAAVKNATGVERAALETFAAAKNYFLYKKDEFCEPPKKTLAELAGCLDTVDKIAERFSDADLAKSSKEVRGLAAQYGKFYDEGVAAVKAGAAANKVMAEKGAAVQNEANAYMAAKKVEYMEAKNALAIVSQIDSLAWKMRFTRQKLKTGKDDKQLESLTSTVAELLQTCDQLEKMHPDVEEQKQIAAARKATQTYAETAQKHYAAQKRNEKSDVLAELDRQNLVVGPVVAKAAEDYLAAKRVKVDKIAESVFIVADIADAAGDARIAARLYMASKAPADWTKLTDDMSKLSKLYEDLRKVSMTAEDQQRIERANKATQEYLANVSSWAENDKNLNEVILPQLKKAGETIVTTAQTTENDAWKASDDASSTVLGIVGTSKFINIVSLLVGVAVALALGFFISKSISKVLAALVGEATRLVDAAVNGKLQTRGNPELVTLEFRPIVEGINRTLDAVIGPLNVTAEYVDRISKGDIPERITDNYNGDFNEIKQNLNACIDVMNGLLHETATLIQATQDGKLQTRGDAQQFAGGWGELVGGVNKLIDAFVGPINVTAEYVDRISKGDIPEKITDNYNGDFNEIKQNLNACIDVMNGLLHETATLIQATQDGKLQTRGNAQQFAGGWGELVGGVNKLIDAFVGPINVTAEYVDRISKGDIPEKITDNYNGDFNEIKQNLNACIDVMNGLLRETTTLIQATQDGKLQTRGNAQQFAGGWGELVGGVNKLIDAFVHPINVTAEYVDRISKGDIPEKITDNYNGDFNEIKQNLNACIDVMNGLLRETATLIQATQDGKLQTRGNAQQFAGGWGELVGGVNKLIDAFVHPINVTAEYVDRISKGDIPPKITDNYNGDFNEIKNNLNACIDVMNGLLRETATLIQATQDGKLQTRGNAQQFAGGWGELVGGVNRLIDAFVNPINDTSKALKAMAAKDFTKPIVGNYAGDFEALKIAVNAVVENIRSAVEQINESASQFAEGSRVIAESSQTLASGAQTQSASVEQMNASIEELARSVEVVKDNANEASKVASQASQLAEEGGKAVQRSGESMELIRTSSQQISEIIQVISEIASQTNLLALNAAIEAARAGEHGMGFAVVADEVRKLAERSNQAAREISTLIKESTQRVEEGAQLSNQTGESLKQIIQASEGTAAKIAEIAAATAQQAASAAEVSTAIQGVSQVTEQTAAGSEEMASSSEELGAQASTLRELVSQFNIGSGSGRGRVALST
jgi:methyl-accepting chemotaxis protein